MHRPILSLIIFFIISSPVHAIDYFVAPSGSDTNPGTSTSSPFKTFSKANSKLVAGDTLNATGDYTTTLSITKSGTAAQPISYIGVNYPKLSVGGSTTAINITGNYINVIGFDVSGGSSHVIYVDSKHVKIENNKVHNGVIGNGESNNCLNNQWGSGIKVKMGGEDIVIKGNSVYENCGEGIAVSRGSNVQVQNNIVRDNFSVNIYIDNSPNSSATDNNVSCTGTYLRDGRRPSGIVIGEEGYPGWGWNRHDNNVVNNIVNGCYQGIALWAPYKGDAGLTIPSGVNYQNGLISGNTVINGTSDSIQVRSINQNVIISNNTIYKAININTAAIPGVTMTNNIISNTPPSPTASPTTIPGDYNNDRHVNIFDYNILVAGYKTLYTIFDYNTLVANYGT